MNINNLSSDQLVDSLLNKGLDAASLRGKTIANNIANVNTKGYKREYVDFEDTLKQNMDNLQLKTTNSKHMNDGNGYGQITLKTDNSSSMNADGNNVDIDNEMTNLAANNLMYDALITQVNNRLSMEQYVIEGK
jgi:flagellar basal-body rod protein FlgB